LLLVSSDLLSTNYYVDSKFGSDLNVGLSHSAPFQTINRLKSQSFLPGDSILFKCGSRWREEFVIDFSGTLNDPIFIGSYGEGEKPIIIGSEKISANWERDDEKIWMTQLATKPKCIWLVINNEIQWGVEQQMYTALNNKYSYYWELGNLYVNFGESLPSEYASVEYSVREFGIIGGWYGESSNYVTIHNLEVRFTANANIRSVGGVGWKITSCKLHHSGNSDESDGQGIQYEGREGYFSNNIIYENGQHGIFLSSFGNTDVRNNIVENNIIHNNYHTSIDLMNDGGSHNSHINTIIRNNRIYNSKIFNGKEIGIQALGYNNGWIKNVVINHNLIYHMKGIGISIMNNSDSIFIHNNTIFDTESACINIDNSNSYVELLNNIGCNNEYYAVIFIHNPTNKRINNNVWFTEKLPSVSKPNISL
jgi:hypothetical protein